MKVKVLQNALLEHFAKLLTYIKWKAVLKTIWVAAKRQVAA